MRSPRGERAGGRSSWQRHPVPPPCDSWGREVRGKGAPAKAPLAPTSHHCAILHGDPLFTDALTCCSNSFIYLLCLSRCRKNADNRAAHLSTSTAMLSASWNATLRWVAHFPRVILARYLASLIPLHPRCLPGSSFSSSSWVMVIHEIAIPALSS